LNRLIDVYSLKIIFGLSIIALGIQPLKALESNQEIIQLYVLKKVDSLILANLDNIERLNINFGIADKEKIYFLKNTLLELDNAHQLSFDIRSAKNKLVFSEIDFKVSYQPLGWRFLGFGGELNRKIIIHLKGWIQQPNSHLRKFNISGELHSLISEDEKKAAEASVYTFLKGKITVGGVWEKYAEPVVVTLSTAIIGYLFFHMRSS
jgi:hypothetical protein